MDTTTLLPTRGARLVPGGSAVEGGQGALPPTAPVLDVVIPVYNEERDLEPSVRRLRAYLDASVPWPSTITIADNASTDATWAIASRLADGIPGVHAIHLDRKGRGRALKVAWLGSPARVLAYMDVDLSTDLAALPALVASLVSGHSDLAIGSRLARGARVVRGPKRELISRCYNLTIRGSLRLGVRDAQCGFKAIRADVARALLPLVEDDAWFFDTEMLVLAQRAGLRVHEVPVDWTDDPDSRVHIVSTATADLRGVARLLTHRRHVQLPGLGRRPSPRFPVARQALVFGVIGIVSTLAYAALYLWFRGAMDATPANALSLVLTAIANTAANRRLTFGVRGGGSMLRDQVGGFVALGIALVITSASIDALDLLAPDASHAVELAVLVAANATATVTRFLVLRSWISRAPRASLRPAQLERTVR